MISSGQQRVLSALVCCGLYPSLSSGQVNVLTSDYDAGRSGANLAETQLVVANVAPGSFGALGFFPVDGQIFGQPLYVSALNIPGKGQFNVLFITTEHNTVYAYDADSAANPNLLWQMSLGPAVPTASLPNEPSSGPFIDVNPEIGILSTGTIDLQTGVLYIAAETLSGSGPQFQLHALDLGTGQERMNGPVDITAVVTGPGAGSVNGLIPFDPVLHIQRPGLLLSNGAVYVAFGSHSDFGDWHGWLMSYDASDLTRMLGVLQTTPDGKGGAIWQSGRGLAGDEAGNVYFVTGNGNYDGVRNFSESLVKVSGSSLAVADWYTPANWKFLADNDFDISAGPAILPGTKRMIGADKNGNVYLVNRDSMGHLESGNTAQVVHVNNGFIFSFALWTRPEATYIYLRDAGGAFKAFRVTDQGFVPSPVSISVPSGGTPRVGMALSANGSQEGTGILWATTGDYFNPAVPAVLHAFDASNLANELWNSAMIPTDALNGFAKFAPPTVANGKVYAAAWNAVVVYGLLPSDGEPDPLPDIAVVANSASYDPTVISPGEMISIFGENLGPAKGTGMQLDQSGNVATSLGGTQVLVDGVPAPLIFVSEKQVNAVTPFGVSSTNAQVQVIYQDVESDPFFIGVQPATPGLFSAGGSGSGQALAINQDGTLNSGSQPADRDSVIVLYATGAGQTTPPVADGSFAVPDQPLKPVLPVTVEIGGQSAQLLYAASAPGYVAGALQVNVVVPSGVVPGPSVPVVMKVGVQTSQSGLTIAVR